MFRWTVCIDRATLGRCGTWNVSWLQWDETSHAILARQCGFHPVAQEL
jgi:hypothetical protein